MIEQKPRGLSAKQKAELWKRWKAGQSLNEIGRALGKDHVVIHFVLAALPYSSLKFLLSMSLILGLSRRAGTIA
jgi:hypothetical protein